MKFWSLTGSFITQSGHHSGAVRALLPLPPIGDVPGPPHLWSASDDGTIFAWCDKASSGKVLEEDGRKMTSSGGKACNVLLAVGIHGAEEIWAGYDDGLICVFGREGSFPGAELRRHRAPVSSLVDMGAQVWSAGGDRSILAWDVDTHTLVYHVGDAGGYVRAAIRTGWAFWAFSSKGVHLWSGDGLSASLEQKLALAVLKFRSTESARARAEAEAKAARDALAGVKQAAEEREAALLAEARAREEAAAAEAAAREAALLAEIEELKRRLSGLEALSLDSTGELARWKAAAEAAERSDCECKEARSKLEAEVAELRAMLEKGGEAASFRTTELEGELDSLRAERDAADAAAERALRLERSAKEDALGAAARLAEELAQARAAAEAAASAAAAELEALRGKSEAEASALRDELAALRAALEEAKGAAEASEAARAALEKESREKLRRAAQEKSDLESALRKAEAENAALRQQISELQAKLNAVTEAAEAEAERLGGELRAAGALSEALESDLESSRAECAAEREAKEAADRRIAELEALLAESRRRAEAADAATAEARAGAEAERAAAAAVRAEQVQTAAARDTLAAELDALRKKMARREARYASDTAAEAARRDREMAEYRASRDAEAADAERRFEEHARSTDEALERARAGAKTLEEVATKLDGEVKRLNAELQRSAADAAASARGLELERRRAEALEKEFRALAARLGDGEEAALKAIGKLRNRVEELEGRQSVTAMQRDFAFDAVKQAHKVAMEAIKGGGTLLLEANSMYGGAISTSGGPGSGGGAGGGSSAPAGPQVIVLQQTPQLPFGSLMPGQMGGYDPYGSGQMNGGLGMGMGMGMNGMMGSGQFNGSQQFPQQPAAAPVMVSTSSQSAAETRAIGVQTDPWQPPPQPPPPSRSRSPSAFSAQQGGGGANGGGGGANGGGARDSQGRAQAQAWLLGPDGTPVDANGQPLPQPPPGPPLSRRSGSGAAAALARESSGGGAGARCETPGRVAILFFSLCCCRHNFSTPPLIHGPLTLSSRGLLRPLIHRVSGGAGESALSAAEAARDEAIAALEAARTEHAAELAMLTAEMNSILGERYQAKEALRQLSAQANAGAGGQAAGPLGPTAAGELDRNRVRIRELEGALKQAVRDYQALLKEVVVLRGAVRDAKEVARQHEVRGGSSLLSLLLTLSLVTALRHPRA